MSFGQMDGLREGSVERFVHQSALLHVNQQSKVSQEISTKDGLLYISDDEIQSSAMIV